MIQLLINDPDVFKFDDQTGQAWRLREDDDGNPVWVENKDDVKKEK